ncbi:carbon starvation induced protein CsiD, partial [Vibrio furnissii]|uniref:carbon starvation induced protein CsiD n=2 Tax=Vibrionaceae TaxID=641 RepID=UPI001EEB0217
MRLETKDAEVTAQHAFTVQPHPTNPRLQVVTLARSLLEKFNDLTCEWDLQSIEYKPFLRFAVADALDKASDYQLGSLLKRIIDDRDQGAFLLEADKDVQAE